LRQRGNKAFLSDASPVPFVVNNDGALSVNAAEVFFASLVAAGEQGELEDEIYVLELGIGVGLFARSAASAARQSQTSSQYTSPSFPPRPDERCHDPSSCRLPRH
jgi:hypothetical protein